MEPQPDKSRTKVPTKKLVPLYSFSPDVSPEFQERVGSFVAGVQDSLSAKLNKIALGTDESVPFASSREGDTITVAIPLTMARGDALAELILLLASSIPTAVLTEVKTGWVEPEWTGETSRQLMGFASAIQAPPKSFASSTSPTDLTRLALWVTACNSALSQPGGVSNAVGSVVPTSVGGAKSASKYLSKVFGSLRAISSESMHQAAIATLERLLKLWVKEQREEALTLVRKNKISWGDLLNKAAPTETKKIKGNMVTTIKAPSKPSRSPFLSAKEKQDLSSLLASKWNTPEALREVWNGLTPLEQHTEYSDYLKMLKEHYEDINKVSTSIHAKLGHRKKWIHSACSELSAAPSSKKDKANEFNWASSFYKQRLDKFNLSVSLVFAPSHYLVDSKYEGDEILTKLFGLRKVISPADCTEEICGVTVNLWKEWALRYSPDLSKDMSSVPKAEGLEDANPFSVLPQAAA